MSKFERGDKVWWVSPIDPRNESKAIFVDYDWEGFPKQYAILATKIGTYVHKFRWQLDLIRHVDPPERKKKSKKRKKGR